MRRQPALHPDRTGDRLPVPGLIAVEQPADRHPGQAAGAVPDKEQRVEAAAAGDLAPFEALLAALERPFDDDPRFAEYEAAPKAEERVTATFCGT